VGVEKPAEGRPEKLITNFDVLFGICFQGMAKLRIKGVPIE